MANMSYCRFQNTNLDLGDCLEAFRNAKEGDTDDKLSREEAIAFVDMIDNMRQFLDELDPVGFDGIDNLEDLKRHHPEVLDL